MLRPGILVRSLAMAAIPALFLTVTAPLAYAGVEGGPVTLTGVVSCDETTGHQIVDWTLTNPSGTTLVISSADVDGSGMTTPGPIDDTATLTPTSVLNNGTATGSTAVTGDGTGDLHLVVTYTLNLDDPTVDGEVVMPGGCVAAVVATSTTAPAAAPEAVSAAPAFTG